MPNTQTKQPAPKPSPKPQSKTAKTARIAEARTNARRKKKEVKTKLLHLSPVAKAEIAGELVNQQLTKQVSGFGDFLREQSVIGVGIGLVLGTQVKTVVDTIMKSLVNPVTTLFLPGQQSLTDKAITIHLGARSAPIGWGAIVYNVLSFIIVAALVYAMYKTLKLDKLAKKK
jgi:large-conductance mechanosensitive channel